MDTTLNENNLGYEDVQSMLLQQKNYPSVKNKRVLLIVDLSNIYYCIRRKYDGRKVDYTKIRSLVSRDSLECKAIAYGVEDNGNSEAFKLALQRNGYELKYKEAKKIQTDRGIIRKGNWDVGIASDITALIDDYDILALVTGDGDFASILELVKNKGKRSIVIGSNISYELKNTADYYREIENDLLES